MKIFMVPTKRDTVFFKIRLEEDIEQVRKLATKYLRRNSNNTFFSGQMSIAVGNKLQLKSYDMC